MELMVLVEIQGVMTVKRSQRNRPLCTETIRIIAHLRLHSLLKEKSFALEKRARTLNTHKTSSVVNTGLHTQRLKH